jgi:hypothetical protein
MEEVETSITEFSILFHDLERLQPKFVGVHELLKDSIHQSADLSDIYYAPSDVYAELEATWPAAEGTLSTIKAVPADSVAVLHCSTYVKRFDYVKEELNIKSIILSKGYDIGVCTGRSFVKLFCSDLVYDDTELISDKFIELFGPSRGPNVFAWLKETLLCEGAGKNPV